MKSNWYGWWVCVYMISGPILAESTIHAINSGYLLVFGGRKRNGCDLELNSNKELRKPACSWLNIVI